MFIDPAGDDLRPRAMFLVRGIETSPPSVTRAMFLVRSIETSPPSVTRAMFLVTHRDVPALRQTSEVFCQ